MESLTPDQERQVRAIVAEMIGQALAGASRRCADAMVAAIIAREQQIEAAGRARGARLEAHFSDRPFSRTRS